MNLSFLFDDKNFYRSMLKLAIPIAFQNLILSSLNLVDNIIIGGLGEKAIASVSAANQYFFLLNLLLFGITSGSAIFTSQYWGNKDIANIKRVLGLCLITGCTGALLFTLGGLFIPKQIIGIFVTDPIVIDMASRYLRIICLSYIATSITFSFAFILRSTGQVKAPMAVSIFALAINTVLNYTLIYGYLGMPRLGTSGSAIATVVARITEMCLLLIVVYSKKLVVASKPSELFRLSSTFISRFFKVTTPVILNESIWAIGVSLYAAVYGRMGTDAYASTSISSTVERIAWVIFLGFGNACAIMIGNKIGEKQEHEAFLYAKRFMLLLPACAMIGGFIVFLTSHYILLAFNVSEAVRYLSYRNLIMFSFFLWVKVFNYISIVGILRSGGDTKFCLFLDFAGVWLVGVPLVAVGGLLLHLPIYWVYGLAYMEEVFKCIVGIPRILSKKWINNLTAHHH